MDNNYTYQNNNYIYEGEESQKQQKPKKEHRLLKSIGYGAVFGMVAGVIILGFTYMGNRLIPGSASSGSSGSVTAGDPSTIKTAATLNNNKETQVVITDVSGIVENCMPSVVAIDGTVTTTSVGMGYYGGYTYEAATAGSGIILGMNDTELLIITNAHVVDDVNNLKVTFIDGSSVSAVVKGSKTSKDLAVVAVKLNDISQETMDSIVIAEIGDIADVKVGESAIAIGNAMGYGQSVTVGIISALGKELTIESSVYSNLIQTDAAINPGNSGGALINAYGQVIGINSCKLTNESVEGMGYSIPISDVMDIIEELMSKETREEVEAESKGYLGIVGQNVDDAYYGYPEGIFIRKVSEGSAAEKAGLRYMDVIVSFDGEDVKTMTELKKLLNYYSVGETVTVEFYRYENGEFVLMTTEVTLSKSAE